LAEKATELLNLVDKYLEAYKDMYDSVDTKRVAAIKPRYCDKKLTDFLTSYFKIYIPDNGSYGIIDLNKNYSSCYFLYVKEKKLGDTQFFTLDDNLKKLFESPSVENKDKTYLQLAQERIAEIRSERIISILLLLLRSLLIMDRVTMNYSALKIIGA